MEEEIKTPYMEPVKFDYNKLREETTQVAIKNLYKVFADNADKLVFKDSDTKQVIEDNFGQVSQKMLEVLIENKVPDCDMQFLIENFQATISMLFDLITRQKRELEKEFLARTIGAKDPGTDKFSREYSTIGDMFKALEKVRIDQDKDGESNYFIVTKK